MTRTLSRTTLVAATSALVLGLAAVAFGIPAAHAQSTRGQSTSTNTRGSNGGSEIGTIIRVGTEGNCPSTIRCSTPTQRPVQNTRCDNWRRDENGRRIFQNCWYTRDQD